MILEKDTIVKVNESKNFIEVQFSNIRGDGKTISCSNKANKTGTTSKKHNEVPKYRASSPKSLYNTRRNIYDIITSTFESYDKTLFITLTYSTPVYDLNRVNNDIKSYTQKLQYHYPDNHFEYCGIIELDSKLSYHYHLLLYFNNKVPEVKESLWTKGHSLIKHLQNNEAIKNIAVYLTSHLRPITKQEFEAYFPNKTIYEIATYKVTDGNFKKKQLVKNARLYYIPENTKIFRHSNGVNKSIKTYMTIEEAELLIEAQNCKKIHSGEINKTFG